jgi:hypothetical protein
VHRSQLLAAPYNPRKIDKRAREKLRANLQKVGLVNALVWNEVTGNLVAGHRRLELLDDLEQGTDYLLDVDTVQMTAKQEKEENVFLNNPTAQGDYDLTGLATLLKSDDFDKKLAGFDRLDLEMVFTDAELGSMFLADDATKQVMKDLAAVGGVKSEPQAAREPERDPDDPGAAAGEAPDAAGSEPAEPAQRRSDAVKEFMRTKDSGSDTETYAVCVFTTRREREIFMAACGQNANTRYIDGAKVFSRLGIDPEGAEWAAMFDNPDAAPPAA